MKAFLSILLLFGVFMIDPPPLIDIVDINYELVIDHEATESYTEAEVLTFQTANEASLLYSISEMPAVNSQPEESKSLADIQLNSYNLIYSDWDVGWYRYANLL